jgi:hypothetical protein
MAWYLAPSLAVLRTEINTRWPGRDRASDGTIGDRRHQLSRSDHNENARGSVNAADFDEDGIDFDEVFEAIKRHPSARYVIYEETLYHRDRGWQPEDYNGDNPHDRHFHLSIDQTRTAEQDRRPWGLLNTTAGGIMLPKQGDKNTSVGYWQDILDFLGYTLKIDDDYGPKTTAAVRAWHMAYLKRHGSKATPTSGKEITHAIALELQKEAFGPTDAQIAAAVAAYLRTNPPALPAAVTITGGKLTGIKAA